ncbi:MAG: 3-deoxy-D-manno-octulosonic acid transferase [Akkermansiaceae bacterium]
MPVLLILFFYNAILPVFVLLAFPGWLLKMWKRGGYGTGLLQRVAYYDVAEAAEPKGGVYIQAVSVGEVLIALKLIDQWLSIYPEQRIVLAVTTATGHEVARKKASDKLRVIYSPLDFGWMVKSVLCRFQPQQILLVESEIWPNFLRIANKKGVPVSVINARLSQRSEARYIQLRAIVQPIFAMLDKVCTQNAEDAERYYRIGVARDKLHVLGSIKFDMSQVQYAPQKRPEFQSMLESLKHSNEQQVILAVSTHAGEERVIVEAYLAIEQKQRALLVIVPRHAERRAEVAKDIESLGMEVILRSDFHQPKSALPICFVVDSTGELRDWTAHANIVIIGKSFLGKGGQNPVEAIQAGVPVICGPYMGNFEPLVTSLAESGGIVVLKSSETLSQSIESILTKKLDVASMTERAKSVLKSHDDAVTKTIKLLHLKAFNHSNNVENKIQS